MITKHGLHYDGEADAALDLYQTPIFRGLVECALYREHCAAASPEAIRAAKHIDQLTGAGLYALADRYADLVLTEHQWDYRFERTPLPVGLGLVLKTRNVAPLNPRGPLAPDRK